MLFVIVLRHFKRSLCWTCFVITQCCLVFFKYLRIYFEVRIISIQLEHSSITFYTSLIILSFLTIYIDDKSFTFLTKFLHVIRVILTQLFKFFICYIWCFRLINFHFLPTGFFMFSNLSFIPCHMWFVRFLLIKNWVIVIFWFYWFHFRFFAKNKL